MREDGLFSSTVQFRWDLHPLNHCVFFSPSPTAGQGKPKPKKAIDLFEDDDEDGDIFSEKFSAPAQCKKEGAEEQVKQPEKKVKINMLVWLNMMSHSAATQLIKNHSITRCNCRSCVENVPAKCLTKQHCQYVL